MTNPCPQKTEAEVDEVLNKAVALFRFLNEKDAFEKYYNQHLSKRLISQRSVSDDAERNMLAKFKVEAGAEFAKSAEGMMRDVKTSEDTVAEYRRHQQTAVLVRLCSLLHSAGVLRLTRFTSPASQKAPVEMVPIVCGSNFWPFNAKDKSCTLPDVLQDGIKAFDSFYQQKHSGRKLTFMADQGQVDVKARFKARTHELSVSTYAMVVLALFEGLGEDEKLRYAVRLFCSLLLPILPLRANRALPPHPPRTSPVRPTCPPPSSSARSRRSRARNTRS